MINIEEKKVFQVNGWAIVALDLVLAATAVYLFLTYVGNDVGLSLPMIAAVVCALIIGLTIHGYFIIQPNESQVFTFLGRYIGSSRTPGLYWTNPFALRKKITLRIFNLNSETLKVNDAQGNPIEIAAVVVWNVVDSAKALFNVEHYENFVKIQSETAIRQLASHYPYDSHDKDQESLRANQEVVAAKLREQVQARLEISGVHIVEARLSHLAYAPEIAQAMLRRQQAQAIIAARRLIVDGAVGMVEMALQSLESQNVVKLDEERKAAMVNNLLVALVSESQAQPIINTGTLYA